MHIFQNMCQSDEVRQYRLKNIKRNQSGIPFLMQQQFSEIMNAKERILNPKTTQVTCNEKFTR